MYTSISMYAWPAPAHSGFSCRLSPMPWAVGRETEVKLDRREITRVCSSSLDLSILLEIGHFASVFVGERVGGPN